MCGEHCPCGQERRTPARTLSRAADIDERLRELEIDGYRVVFTRKVTLLPVELAPMATKERPA